MKVYSGESMAIKEDYNIPSYMYYVYMKNKKKNRNYFFFNFFSFSFHSLGLFYSFFGMKKS